MTDRRTDADSPYYFEFTDEEEAAIEAAVEEIGRIAERYPTLDALLKDSPADG